MKYIKKFEATIIHKSLIEELDLSTNDLTKLPDLSEYINLKVLYCEHNKLTSLPKLPDTLTELYCYINNLESLPELPETLTYLYCMNNKLTSLPELPYTLVRLYCRNNQLPFEDLKGYKKWYEKNKHIIDKEGLEFAYQLHQNINKYNL